MQMHVARESLATKATHIITSLMYIIYPFQKQPHGGIKMTFRLLLVVLLVPVVLSSGFECPTYRQCTCPSDDPGLLEYQLTCWTGNSTSHTYELTIRPRKQLNIQCSNSPDWTEFASLKPSLNLGDLEALVFQDCLTLGEQHSEKVANLLGIRNLTALKFARFNGTLTRHDLKPYPSVRSLYLSDNQLGNVSVDLLRGEDLIMYKTLSLVIAHSYIQERFLKLLKSRKHFYRLESSINSSFSTI